MFCFNRRLPPQSRLLPGMLAGFLLFFPVAAQATVLWSHPGAVFVRDNGDGEDILHGAIPPQDTNSSRTLYFRFRVDPISDTPTKSIADFEAGFVFFEKGEEHLGLGNSWSAWAYCAMNVPKNPKGYQDLNSGTPEPPFHWEYIRANEPKYIAFKVQYVPGHDAEITAWLNPDLSSGATEFNQPTNIVTQFEADATFDEIRLIHRGGNGGGWTFSQMVAGTSFEDLRLRYFWQQWWFFAVCGLGLLMLVAGAAQLLERRRARVQIQRLEKERTVATERARIARDIHDDLGASLTKIYKLAEILDGSPATAETARAVPQTISLTARETLQAMDEIVWAVNPQNDALNELADYLVYFAEDFLRPTGIACALDVPLKLPAVPVTAETRHNLFMAVKEALNNAVKHATATQIRFGLNYTDNRLTVQISDNGRGFHSDEMKSAGNGLENMRKRMDAIDGTLTLHSEPGQGTLVKLQVAIPDHRMIAP